MQGRDDARARGNPLPPTAIMRNPKEKEARSKRKLYTQIAYDARNQDDRGHDGIESGDM